MIAETHTLSCEEQMSKCLSFGFATKVIKNGWYRRCVPEQRPTEHNRCCGLPIGGSS